MIDNICFRQAELLLRVLPLVDREAVFALKGGTAINFFVWDLPRVSVDIDLVYLPIGERDSSLRELSAALVRISREVESRIPGTTIIPKRLRGTDLWSGCSVQREDAAIKIEPNLVMRGSLFPPERRTLTPKARSVFELSVECRTLAEKELYAGKLCAARTANTRPRVPEMSNRRSAGFDGRHLPRPLRPRSPENGDGGE